MQALVEIVERFGAPKVALLGDFMLDRYVYGHVERISPEAPVPVLRSLRGESVTGGAGNVARAILALGGHVACVGVVGQDPAGEEVHRLLNAAGADTSALVRVKGRRTTVKARYVGLAQHRHPQQMLRVDEEATDALDEEIQGTLRAAVRNQMASCKLLALEDYNKGVLCGAYVQKMIADARKAGAVVLVDPARIDDYRRYRGATLLTPNRYETELASGITITDEKSLEQAGRQVLQAADAEALVITLDKEGAYLLPRDGEGRRVPASRPRQVYDVTGAGDEVLAMLSVAIASGCPYPEATALANIAGGLEVERFGMVPIRREEVLEELRRLVGLRGGKVMTRAHLAAELARRRRLGEKVVFTNGCFDLLHMGHVQYLQQARELGSCLVVAINSDESVRRLKGPPRPIIGADERAAMLAALECVDYVTIFPEDTPEPLLELLKPDLLVKGGTTPVVVGREIVERYGGKVLNLQAVKGLSTTKIIERILSGNSSAGGS